MSRMTHTNSAQHLLDTWTDALDARDRALVAGVAQRISARTAMAQAHADDPALNAAGFVRFERVFAAEPLALFGQRTSALAATRVTISRAARDADGTFVPGAPLFVARMSDRALTTMVLQTNRGEAAAPLTVEELGGRALPAYVQGASAHDEAFKDAVAKCMAELDRRMADVGAALADGGSAKARTQAQKALAHARDRIALSSELGFYLEQRLSTLSKRRVELVVEAAHTALHAERVAAAMAQPRLPAPEPMPFDAEAERFANPMLDSAMADMTAEEGAAIRRALALEMAATLGRQSAQGSEINGWPSGQDLTRMFYTIDQERTRDGALRERFESFNGLARSAMHHSKVARDPRQAVMGLVQSEGWEGLLHSSLPDRSGKTCSLRIETAWEEGSFGEARLRTDHGPYMELMLTPDDFMLALRGHPTGAMVPCTFRALAGCWINPQKAQRTKPSDVVVQDAVGRVVKAPGTVAVLEAMDALDAHLATSSTGKAWKERTQELLDAATTALGAHKVDLATVSFAEGAHAMAGYVGSMVQREIAEMGKALPPGVLPLLLNGPSHN